MKIADLIVKYRLIIKEYQDEQSVYEISDYLKGVLSTYRHVLVDLEEYLKNYEND